ncbi:MAG: hypothetical protein CENE_02444 [Candidatus Celerinatantimonas neptuna]|nr:MAG: hypothetical protein CENE_02444 [Candidatus Celerinatantimonas neptuna]
MGIDSILIIVWFTLKPYLWVLLLLVAVLLASWFLGRHRHGKSSFWLWLMSFVIALLAIRLAPYLTHSSIDYVRTPFDYVVLVLIGIGSFIYTWLVLRKWLIR